VCLKVQPFFGDGVERPDLVAMPKLRSMKWEAEGLSGGSDSTRRGV